MNQIIYILFALIGLGIVFLYFTKEPQPVQPQCSQIFEKNNCNANPSCKWAGCVPYPTSEETWCGMLANAEECATDETCQWSGCVDK